MTKYEVQFYNDIHRIADALEKLVPIFAKNIEKVKKEEMIKNFVDEPIHTLTIENPNIQYVCPYCHSKNIKSIYGTINVDGSNHRTHYICGDCHKEFDVDKNTNEIFI